MTFTDSLVQEYEPTILSLLCQYIAKAKCFKYTILFNPCDRLEGSWYTFILQMNKPRLTEIKQLA